MREGMPRPEQLAPQREITQENPTDKIEITTEGTEIATAPAESPEDNIEITVEEPLIPETPDSIINQEKKPHHPGIFASAKRSLAGGLAALSLATAVLAPEEAEAGNRKNKIIKTEKKKNPEKKYTPKTHQMGELEGRAFASLYNLYTGIEGRAKNTETIDFQKQLDLMWKQKIEKSKDNKVVKEIAENLKKEYEKNDNNPMTFEQYNKYIKNSINDLKLNWDKVAKIRKLNPEEKQIAENIGKNIGAQELIAYSLTELMPSNDGKFNVKLMDFLLRNGGEKYVNSIPAFYDEKASFGPYQFTEFAVYDTPKEKRGASILNQAVDGKKIPGSVSKLQGKDHHKAAYLFAVNNVINLIKKLDKNELKTFAQKWHNQKNDLVQYIATAHHAPHHAANDAKKWITTDMDKPYTEYARPILAEYAQKTQANLTVLQNPEKPNKPIIAKK